MAHNEMLQDRYLICASAHILVENMYADGRNLSAPFCFFLALLPCAFAFEQNNANKACKEPECLIEFFLMSADIVF